jgi:hypothetical protein
MAWLKAENVAHGANSENNGAINGINNIEQ